MFEQLFKSIEERITIGEAEKELCRTLFIPKKLRRKQYLLQEEDVCRNIAFVETGMLRLYSIDQKGTEHIVQFAPEGWWISDMYSFLAGMPAQYNIDALEDSELLLLNRNVYEQLLQEAPVFERYFRVLIQNSFIAMQRRLMSKMSRSAEEMYGDFMQQYPAIAQRVPQQYIASYLGITPESLSRIRRQMQER